MLGRVRTALLGVGLGCHWAWAEVYSNFLDSGAWRVDASQFECALVHSIPFMGDAVFARRAGDLPRFYFQPGTYRFAAGEVLWGARSPVWLEVPHQTWLGSVTVADAPLPLQLAAAETDTLLAELHRGRELVFREVPETDAALGREVIITPVEFRAFHEVYQACLPDLLPVNFDQVQRTSVYFNAGLHEEMSPAEAGKLDDMLRYVSADSTVRAFYIDGHTDNVGNRADNLALAQKRAEEVARYLTGRGIAESAITVRWHGQRYPIASNGTAEGRAQNRRVTVRLEREVAP